MAEDKAARGALGFGSLLALGINGIVGVGIFFTPARVAELAPGASGIAAYALTALALTPVAWVYATLGGRFDEDGGPYVWARAAFGARFGFAVGWIAYVSALFSTAAVVAGLSAHAAPSLGFTTEGARHAFEVLCIVALCGVAASGLKPSALVWSSITLLKLLPLLVLAGLFAASGLGAAALPEPAVGRSDIWRAGLVVVFALQGFEIVSVPAGHVRRGALSVPAATLGSLMVAAALYVVLHSACLHALPDLARSPAPLVQAGGFYGGPGVASLIAVGTNISALGIAFAMFAMTPRYLSALGRAEALGAWIGHEDRRGVPQRSLWLSAAAVVALVLLAGLLGERNDGADGASELFVLSSVAVLAQYAASALSLVVLALRRATGLGPRDLWPAPFALGAIVLVARAARPIELVAATAVIALGGVILLVRHRLGSGSR
jgi:basic amino acid/polyamine antiporter, APA family